MSCIKSEIIQIYIDREMPPEQVISIEKHIAKCDKCSARIQHQFKLISGVKKSLHLLVDETEHIPMVDYAPRPGKSSTTKGKKLIYFLSAACLLLFMLVNIPGKSPIVEPEKTLIPASGWEVDANRTLTEQPLIINVRDAKGDVTEYMIR